MRGSATLSNSVAEAIKQKIIDGEYSEGDQLPTEQELMSEMNVSRTTIREAVKILVSQNVLSIEKGKGTFVHTKLGVMEDPFGLVFIPRDTLVTDFQIFRDINEPYVCYLAAMNATDQEIREMQEILSEMEELVRGNSVSTDQEQSVLAIAAHELSFHNQLYKMTHNVLYQRILPATIRIVNDYYATKLYSKGFPIEKCLEYHKKLYKAIVYREPQKAYLQCREQCVEIWDEKPEVLSTELTLVK